MTRAELKREIAILQEARNSQQTAKDAAKALSCECNGADKIRKKQKHLHAWVSRAKVSEHTPGQARVLPTQIPPSKKTNRFRHFRLLPRSKLVLWERD